MPIVVRVVPFTASNREVGFHATTKDGSGSWILSANSKLRKRMDGKAEQMFFAECVGDKIRLGNYAPWNAWATAAQMETV